MVSRSLEVAHDLPRLRPLHEPLHDEGFIDQMAGGERVLEVVVAEPVGQPGLVGLPIGRRRVPLRPELVRPDGVLARLEVVLLPGVPALRREVAGVTGDGAPGPAGAASYGPGVGPHGKVGAVLPRNAGYDLLERLREVGSET